MLFSKNVQRVRLVRNAAVWAVVALLCPLAGNAALFNVNTTNDTPDANPGDGIAADASGDCSLRAAIMEANLTPGTDIINLPAGTYTLTIPGAEEDACQTGDLDITSDITIQGSAACDVIIDGNQLDRVLHVHSGNILFLLNLTIENGKIDPGRGGGIRNLGMLTMQDCVVRNCEAIGAQANAMLSGFGGAIHNSGTANLTRVTLNQNYAKGGLGQDGTTCGGGGGAGGGGGFGGGFFNSPSGVSTLTLCTIVENTAEGGQGGKGFPHNGCDLNNGNGGMGGGNGGAGGLGINGGSQSGSNGGFGGGGGGGGSSWSNPGSGGNGGYGAGGGGNGARLGGGTGGNVGTGGFGGGDGGLGNWSAAGGSGGGAGLGGGVFNNNGSITILNSTIAFNQTIGGAGNSGGFTGPGGDGQGIGGGVFNRGGTFDVSMTAIGANTASDSDPDAYGTITSSNGFNYIGIPGSANLTGNTGANQTGAAFFYPPTGCPQTVLPMYCSPVVNAGSPPQAQSADQLGNAMYNLPDIGAIELQTPVPQAPFLGNDTSACSLPMTLTADTWPYDYLWNTGETTQSISANATGLYWVQIVDSLCVMSDSIILSGGLAMSATLTPPACAGSTGSAEVFPAGGQMPYTFQWDAGANNQTTAQATGLQPGSYTVTVTDNLGCTGDTTLTIAPPSGMNLSLAETDETCANMNDGTATVTVTSGVAPYTYQWGAAAGNQTVAALTGVAPGSYVVTVTDNDGCTVDTTAVIAAAHPLVLNADSSDVSCFGGADGTAAATVTGGTGAYSFQWDAGAGSVSDSVASGLATGTYQVVVTDANGCNDSIQVQVNEPATLAITPVNGSTSCNGGADGTATLIVTGGVTPYNFSWDVAASNQVDSVAISLAAGSYSVTLTDANGCTRDTTVSVSEPAAIVTNTSTSFTSCPGYSDATSTIIPSGGTVPYLYMWSTNTGAQTGPQATGLAAGTYTCTTTDSNGCTEVDTVIVNDLPGMGANTSATAVLCYGDSTGAASVSAFGGIGVYTFQWDAAADSQTTSVALNLGAGSYSVTVSDGNGCSLVQQATVTQPPLLQIQPDSVPVLCFGGSSGAATANPVGGTGPYSWQWSAATGGQTTQTASGLPLGTYAVTVTDAQGCTADSTASVTQPTPLTAGISGTDALCNGFASGSATAQPAGATAPYFYQWSANAASQTTQSANNIAAGTYTVTVTDANGCTVDTFVTISEPPPLVLDSFNIVHTTQCGGTDGQLELFGSGGTGGINYSINGALLFQTVGLFTGLPAGSYDLALSDANLCLLAGPTVQIVDPTPPTLTTAFTDVTCNAGADGEASAMASGGIGPYTWQWSGTTQTTPTATGLAAGTYTVTTTDAQNCTATQVVTISEPVAVTLTVSTTDVLCNGAGDGSATANPVGGVGAYTYQWGPNTGNQTTQTATGLQPGSYNVLVSDSSGCSASAGNSLTEPAAVTLTVAGSNVQCAGDLNGTAEAQPAGGLTPYTYQWSANTTGQTTALAVNLGPGSYSVTVQDANGCSETGSATVASPPLLTATADSIPVTCNGDADGRGIAYPAGGVQPYSFAWGGAATGQTTQQAWNVAAGVYPVTVTDASGCTAAAFTVVTEPNPLQVSVLAATDPQGCQGNDGSIDLDVQGGNPPYQYSLNTGASFAPLTYPSISGLSSGGYGLMIRDANGCTDYYGVVQLNEPAPYSIDIGPDTSVCANSGFYLDAGPAASYQWSTGATTQTIFPDTSDTFYVTITDAGGCIAYTSAVIELVPQPDATITGRNEFCLNESPFRFVGATEGGTWHGPGIQQSSGRFVPSLAGVGQHYLHYRFVGTCPDRDSVLVTVRPVPQLYLGPDRELEYGFELTLYAGPHNYQQVEWQDGWPEVEYLVTEAGIYSATVSNIHGCTNTDSVKVTTTCRPEIWVPNAFTPDGDGNNDVFKLHGLNTGTFFQCFVFNRNGELLWQSSSLDDAWDGTFNGKPVPGGTYVYRLDYEGCVQHPDRITVDRHFGHVILMR